MVGDLARSYVVVRLKLSEFMAILLCVAHERGMLASQWSRFVLLQVGYFGHFNLSYHFSIKLPLENVDLTRKTIVKANL